MKANQSVVASVVFTAEAIHNLCSSFGHAMGLGSFNGLSQNGDDMILQFETVSILLSPVDPGSDPFMGRVFRSMHDIIEVKISRASVMHETFHVAEVLSRLDVLAMTLDSLKEEDNLDADPLYSAYGAAVFSGRPLAFWSTFPVILEAFLSYTEMKNKTFGHEYQS